MKLIVLLMCVYLALAAGLAIAYDRRFFINDGFAIAVFGFLLTWLVIAGEARGAATVASPPRRAVVATRRDFQTPRSTGTRVWGPQARYGGGGRRARDDGAARRATRSRGCGRSTSV